MQYEFWIGPDLNREPIKEWLKSLIKEGVPFQLLSLINDLETVLRIKKLLYVDDLKMLSSIENVSNYEKLVFRRMVSNK